MSAQSDTPRTDAAILTKSEWAEFAGQLERELNQWEQCAEELAGELNYIVEHHYSTPRAEHFIAKFNQLRGKTP